MIENQSQKINHGKSISPKNGSSDTDFAPLQDHN